MKYARRPALNKQYCFNQFQLNPESLDMQDFRGFYLVGAENNRIIRVNFSIFVPKPTINALYIMSG